MIITVGAEKGGVSKTRISTSFAAMAKEQGVDVVLLDTDKQGSAISWARIRNDEGITPYIPVLPLPAAPAKEIANLSEKYPLVVVDIGAQNYRTFLEAAILSDLVLVPCGPDQQEIESTLNVFAALQEMGPRHKDGAIPAKVVLTRVSAHPRSKTTSELRQMFIEEEIPVLSSHISQLEAWRTTGKTGRAIHELKATDRSQRAEEEMRALYNEICAISQA